MLAQYYKLFSPEKNVEEYSKKERKIQRRGVLRKKGRKVQRRGVLRKKERKIQRRGVLRKKERKIQRRGVLRKKERKIRRRGVLRKKEEYPPTKDYREGEKYNNCTKTLASHLDVHCSLGCLKVILMCMTHLHVHNSL